MMRGTMSSETTTTRAKRPSNDFAHSQTKRPRNPNRVPKIVFKVIIAAQVVILVSMWKMMLEIIPSPRLEGCNYMQTFQRNERMVDQVSFGICIH
jgi:hypothetical protein